MRANLIGPSVDNFANRGRLVNCYREPVAGGWQVRSVPGMVSFSEIGRNFPRAMGVFGAELLVACEKQLVRINTAGVATEIGDLLPGNQVSIARNNDFATIVANGQYFTWDGNALTRVTPGAAYVAGSVATLGQYTVVTQLGGRVVQWSNLADASTFDPLNFASAEMTDEPIIRAVAHGGQLFVFKANFLERWTTTGVAGSDVARIPGGDEPVGLLAFPLVCEFAGGMAFVASRGNVILYGQGAISPPQVNDAIARETPQSLTYYDWAGHGFLCLTFTDGAAWCYDLTTGEWHERDGWNGRFALQAAGFWLVANEDGRIGRLDTICTNFGVSMVRQMVSTPMEVQGNLFQVRSVRAYPRVGQDTQFSSDARNRSNVLAFPGGTLGVGNQPLGTIVATGLATVGILSGDGGSPAEGEDYLGTVSYEDTPAVVELFTSKDGRLWSAGKPRDVGETGNYRQQLVWRNQGEFRKGYLRFDISSTADVPMMATVDVE